jgi:hypothetical protein
MVVASVVATLVTRTFQAMARSTRRARSSWARPGRSLRMPCSASPAVLLPPLYLRFPAAERGGLPASARAPHRAHDARRSDRRSAGHRAPRGVRNGYSVVGSILHSSWTAQALVAVLLLKVVRDGRDVRLGRRGRRVHADAPDRRCPRLPVRDRRGGPRAVRGSIAQRERAGRHGRLPRGGDGSAGHGDPDGVRADARLPDHPAAHAGVRPGLRDLARVRDAVPVRRVDRAQEVGARSRSACGARVPET